MRSAMKKTQITKLRRELARMTADLHRTRLERDKYRAAYFRARDERDDWERRCDTLLGVLARDSNGKADK